MTTEEQARLSAILEALPTTEAEDEALLAGGALRGWREVMLVDFRRERKRALRLAVERLAGLLATAAEL